MTPTLRLRRAPSLSATAAALFLSACLDPLADDTVAHPELVLPAGSTVADLADDPLARAAIDRNDGLAGAYVPLRSAFAHGERIWYWDFGEASPVPIAMYVLVEESDQGVFTTARGSFSPIPGHPPIFDAIVGDPGYSPWWQFVLWPVSDTYDGQVIASFSAMDEAFRQGLVDASITLPQAINCPVVLPEARLEESPEDTSGARLPSAAYYKGKRVHYFSFNVAPVIDSVVSTPPAYTLRREGGELLSEAVRGVDMTDDGDLYDSNDLFSATPGDADYSDMVSLVEVVVHDGKFIDLSDSDARSELDDAADLFRDGMPDPDVVIALRPGATLLNRPVRPPPSPSSEGP